MSRPRLQHRRFCISESVTIEGNAAFPTQRKVSPQIYRTFQNSEPSRISIVSIGATQRDVSCAQCVPYLITSQVSRSPREDRSVQEYRPSYHRDQRPDLSRSTHPHF